ncbi:MAG: pilus assembly PilX family protein [Thermoleophilia bacterium]
MIRTRREDGVAILTVILAVMLLTILSAALFLVARVSLERAAANTDSTRALDVAESGLETAAAAIIQGGFTAGQTGTLTGSLAGKGEYEVTWTAETALPWFTMISTGYYPDKTAPVGRRRVRAEVFSLNPWDFQYAGGMTGATVNGNVKVYGPFYVNDNLTLSGTAGVFGGPLIIFDTTGPGNGDLILDSNSADIGTSTDPVPLFIDGAVDTKKTPNSYHAAPIYSWAPELEFPDLTEPELAYYRYDNASSPWLTGTERPTAVWDQDTSTNGNTGLTFSKTYPLTTEETAYLKGTRVAWSRSPDGKALTITFDNSGGIRPILFVDGNLTFKGGGGNDGLTTIRYQGAGTIVAKGSIAITGNLVPVDSTMPNNGDPATLTGFPATNRLGLITRSNINFEGSGSEWLAAALYAGGTASFSYQGNLRGSVVTRLLNLGDQVPKLWTEPGFSATLPPRMPGSDVRINSIIGWSELTPTP